MRDYCEQMKHEGTNCKINQLNLEGKTKTECQITGYTTSLN